MATFYSFQFIPLNSTIKIKMDAEVSIKKNKDLAIVEKLLSFPEIAEEISEQLINFLQFQTFSLSNFTGFERMLFENLVKKLSFKLPSRREDKEDHSIDEDFEESEFKNKHFDGIISQRNVI